MPIKTIENLSSERIITKQTRFVDKTGTELVIVAKRKMPFGNWICHQSIESHIDSKTGYLLKDKGSRTIPRALASEAEIDYQGILKRLSNNGFVETSTSAKPDRISEDNWEISSNLPRHLSVFCKNSFAELEEKGIGVKTSQSNPASSWYSGDLPDPKSLTGYVGSSSVDASQLSGFNGVQDAIQLVNQFDSSLLRDVAFIFNTSGGAYGVYVPWLDEQIKNEEVKSYLKSKGFEIDDTNPNFFTTKSNSQNVSEEEIKREINNVQSQVHMQGGNTFGINMSKIMAAAQANANEAGMTSPEDLYDIAVLHLGGTMVHEAVHAKGSTSEGPSEQAEMAFTQWALEIINKKRFQKAQSEGNPDYAPLVSDPNNRRSWYDKEISKKIEKTAQYGAQFSLQNPTDGIAPWAGILWDSGTGALEDMLNRRRQGPQTGSGSLEKRLRNQDRFLPDLNPSEITEMLLERDHDEFSSYNSIEGLLEERRPKPLAIMLGSSKNGLKKQANDNYNSSFGWMNNLDLPMSERMIQDEESDDFLNFDWKAIRKQPRYNPQYDALGMYYKWNEPRMNSPELFDRMVAERPSSSPALRFASDKNSDEELSEIVDVFFRTLELTSAGEIAGTRFLCGWNFLPIMDKFFSGKDVSIYLLPSLGEYKGEKIYPVWVTRKSIPERAVSVAEAYASGQTDEPKASDIFENITGLSRQRKKIIDEVLAVATELAAKMGMDDLFLLGAFPRAFVSKESWANVFDLDFSSSSPRECVKFGSLLAQKVGGEDLKILRSSSTLTWMYKGLKCDFRGKWVPKGTVELMTEVGIPMAPVNIDVYSRDFTINMFAYKISDGNVYDVSGQSAKDMQRGVIRTYFNPKEVLKRSPITILRAIKYSCRFRFKIAEDLKEAMLENINNLIKECDQGRLSLALREIIREGAQKADEMLSEYGLQGLYEIEKSFEE